MVKPIEQINIDLEDSPVDMRYVASPENTFALIAMADYKRDIHPVYAGNWIEEIFRLHSNHVNVIYDEQATHDNFLRLLEEGIKWPFFMFYENAHGATRSFRLYDTHVLAREIYDILKKAKHRVLGFFDSCYSGSMIDTENLMKAPAPGTADENAPDIASYITSMFTHDMAFKAGSGSQLPILKLCSAAEDKKITTYEPEQHTQYASAVRTAWKKTKDGGRYVDFDSWLLQKGSYGPKDPEHVNHVVPQFSTFGGDFSDNLAFT